MGGRGGGTDGEAIGGRGGGTLGALGAAAVLVRTGGGGGADPRVGTLRDGGSGGPSRWGGGGAPDGDLGGGRAETCC